VVITLHHAGSYLVFGKVNAVSLSAAARHHRAGHASLSEVQR